MFRALGTQLHRFLGPTLIEIPSAAWGQFCPERCPRKQGTSQALPTRDPWRKLLSSKAGGHLGIKLALLLKVNHKLSNTYMSEAGLAFRDSRGLVQEKVQGTSSVTVGRD